jgi:hypothetical protein
MKLLYKMIARLHQRVFEESAMKSSHRLNGTDPRRLIVDSTPGIAFLHCLMLVAALLIGCSNRQERQFTPVSSPNPRGQVDTPQSETEQTETNNASDIIPIQTTQGNPEVEDISIRTEASRELGSYYVIETAEERLGPARNAKITNTLYRQQRVEVYEFRGEWARVSKFYSGEVEGISGTVARWIATSSLSKERPKDLPQPKIVDDSRIGGLPEVGDGGLTERDIQILHAAARYFIETGRARRVEFGDKSLNRANTYYLNFGGPSNHFFSPSEIPDLEQRIRQLENN